MEKPLWDAQRHNEYVRLRDEAIERRADQTEGRAAARDIDATWAALPVDERQVIEYLVFSGARSCIGNCADPLLSRLVERGLLSWPPGVRPVLTDELATVFSIAPALWAELNARGGELLAPARDHARLIAQAAKQFGARVTPLVSSDAPDPNASTA